MRWLRRDRPGGLLTAVALCLVLAGLVAGLIVIGSPAQERRRRADEARVDSLESLHRDIEGFYKQKRRLPAALEQLPESPFHRRLDPVTRRPFLYRPLDGDTYELGADFETDTRSQRDPNEAWMRRGEYHDVELPFWRHGSGPQTFRLHVGRDNAAA